MAFRIQATGSGKTGYRFIRGFTCRRVETPASEDRKASRRARCEQMNHRPEFWFLFVLTGENGHLGAGGNEKPAPRGSVRGRRGGHVLGTGTGRLLDNPWLHFSGASTASARAGLGVSRLGVGGREEIHKG
jgi:hypothetical protein